MFSTLNVNAKAIVRISQAVAKNMIDAGIKGSIVNISSTISTVSHTRINIILYNVFFLYSFSLRIVGLRTVTHLIGNIIYNQIVLNLIFRELSLITQLIVHPKAL